MESVDIIRDGTDYRSLHREPLPDVTGRPVADLGLAPELLIRRILATGTALAEPDSRLFDAIAAAGQLFATGNVAGESPEQYCHHQSRTSGIPIRAAHRALHTIAEATAGLADALTAQQPRATGSDGVAWARRGHTLAVLAPGNHPLPHAEWLPALGLGYRVLVRPSRRDPYTPRRLIRALLAAGVAPERLALLPTDHATAATLVRAADLGLVYGGTDVVTAYAGNPAVRVQGPGRSKVLITGDADPYDYLDVLVESVAGDGGTQCLNATTILLEQGLDHARFARELAERLAALVGRPPEHPDAELPVRTVAEARAVADHVTSVAGAQLVGDSRHRYTDLEDGSAALLPAVFHTDTPGAPTATEQPFPCVWIAPWTRNIGIGALADSLALTLLSRDATLAARCAATPTIRAVHLGPTPTTTYHPHRPHDGYLSHFLMEARTYTSDWGRSTGVRSTPSDVDSP
ncbi:aldehyde dehydrogenase family protein [Nocardia sp. BMG51109]|uniref:aldehyde dehydrogenase family protein n=1 Tax=Nocardia sp. BMG51109 TaxID=1056816 RepID=UPI0004652F0D|nr:aldehyde dehydrogenase family protein [Nocardia sp. BMG51109]